MSLAAGGAVALAAALDRTLSEPPGRVHPVAWLGSVVGRLDDGLPESRAAGVAVAAVVPIAFAAVAALVVHWTGRIDPRLAPLTAAGVLFVCSSHRMLVDVAVDVVDLVETDIETARREVRALAGRDASELSPARLRSAVVESAAENLADGLVAPLFAFGAAAVLAAALGGSSPLALGGAAGAAAWVKAVNTLDSMLGYPGRRFGWGPARLDDAVMWLPARATAFLIAVVGITTAGTATAGTPRHVRHTLGRARTAARTPSSPNSGWPMATLAAVLDVRLEKPGAYTLFPERELPTADEAREGIRLVSRAGWLGVGLVAVVVTV